jgi:hypothetical protein
MNKIELLYGFVIGILTSVIGNFLFITFFTDFDFISGIQVMKSEGKLGKLITLGSILDLIAFAVLLRLNKDIMARGVVLAVISIAILTLFV